MSTQEQEKKEPTREEIILFLKDSLEIAELRAKLQSLNTQIAVGRADELKALIFIGQVTNPKPDEDLENHVITEEDMQNNPDLGEAGVKVGDNIQIPKEAKKLLKRKPTEE